MRRISDRFTCTTIMALLVVPAVAQVRPSFEVASIKPVNPEDRRLLFSIQPGGRVLLKTLKLIAVAYDVKLFQISGGPAWMGSDLFEITAKAEGSADYDQVMLMLQSLLADRFHLVTRRETREIPVYALLLAKNGPKFKEAKEPSPGRTTVRRGLMIGEGIGMATFIGPLSSFMERVVVDKTGLTGKYDLKMQWQPDENQVAMFQAMGVPEGFGAPPLDPLGPTLFTALQDQLGLRLESQKGPVEMLVIERVEKPTSN
jgi:uncharacterized protein (TIGR03435 family)